MLAALALVLGVGALVQACSDNKGPVGPTRAGQNVPTTGFSNTADDIRIRVQANPASTEPGRRVSVVVIVTNTQGQPLAGKRVFVNTTTTPPALGTIDQPVGFTDDNGVYTTTLIVRCSDAGVTGAGASTGTGTSTGTSATSALTVKIDAFVEGASSATAGGNTATVTITGPGNNPPCPGSA